MVESGWLEVELAKRNANAWTNFALQSACATLLPALVALRRGKDCNERSLDSTQQAYLDLRLGEVASSDSYPYCIAAS
jgi:hypothetical protein